MNNNNNNNNTNHENATTANAETTEMVQEVQQQQQQRQPVAAVADNSSSGGGGGGAATTYIAGADNKNKSKEAAAAVPAMMLESEQEQEGEEGQERSFASTSPSRRGGGWGSTLSFFKDENSKTFHTGGGSTRSVLDDNTSSHSHGVGGGGGGGDNNSHIFSSNKDPPQGWGRGILQDFKSTVAKHWLEELQNFNFKTVAVSLFLFIAVIAPSITFGAVYAKRTSNYMGAVELLLATAWCGIFYSLAAGMPMMINGGTGPVLTFQALIYELSKSWDVPFLTLNAYVGLWVAFYMILSGFCDLNRFVKYATRFTDEIFAFLIISIFILDAIGNPTSNIGLLHYFNPDHPHNEAMEVLDENYNYLTTAFLSLFLGLGTTVLALALRLVKHSPFCCNDAIRSAVTDFAITMSVALFTLVKELVFPQVPTEQLNVPDSFATTYTCCDSSCTTNWPKDCPTQLEAYGRRPWFVDLTDLNGKAWVIVVAAGPAALAFILAFLDNGITWHIINHPSNKISHGEAYNYDTCISAIMIAVNSLFGLPWLVASTVPCMMHVQAMSERTKDGEVLSVQESRLTGFFTHVLVGASLSVLTLIKLIPLPVLYGVFLFMGLVALPSQQFWQRILLMFMQPSKYPETPYTVFMEKNRIHLYTVIQLLFFGLLYTVKTIKAIAIAFPFFILLCIPVRLYLLPRIFYGFELVVLDGSPEEVNTFVRENAITDDDDVAVPLVGHKTMKDDGDDEESEGGKDKDVEEAAAVVEEEEVEDDDDKPTDLPQNINIGNSIHTPEMFELARRKSGRVRKKTVSDLSGMLSPPNTETVWSHVLR